MNFEYNPSGKKETRERVPRAYSFAALDLRDPEEFPEAAAYNGKLFADNTVWGVEMTTPEFADRCAVNIDPQHIGRDPTTAAIEEAVRIPLPDEDVMLVTTRADLDSIGGMAVLTIRNEGGEITEEMMERIQIVAEVDKFKQGPYPGPRPMPTEETMRDNRNDEALAAINAEISDPEVPLEKRVEAMKEWLKTGKESEKYRARADEEILEIIRDFENGKISYEMRAGGRIVFIETTHNAEILIGYRLAPVVVARNPAQPVETGGTQIKYSICTWDDTFADIRGALDELNELEPGWGGQQNVGGSPEIGSSRLTVEQVIAVVEKYLKTGGN